MSGANRPDYVLFDIALKKSISTGIAQATLLEYRGFRERIGEDGLPLYQLQVGKRLQMGPEFPCRVL
jgi:hypothetical protein